jgi:DNA-binding LytR/AlgR family response regulator
LTIAYYVKEKGKVLSIAILDDNIKVLEMYEELIPCWFARNGIKGRLVTATSDCNEFLEAVRKRSVNVCIIDINLRSEISGLHVAKKIRQEKLNTEIIFCTGMLEYMHKAFDVNAYHYIIKPIGKNLEKCLIKLYREIEARQSRNNVFVLKTKSDIFYITHDSISHIVRQGNKSIIYSSGNMYEVYDSLDSIIAKLDADKFIKCCRSQVINRDYIRQIDKANRKVVLTNGYEGKLGRLKSFRQILKGAADNEV